MPHGGKRPGSGRKKGTPNKTTGQLKDIILQALSESGGVNYLKKVANEDMKAFCGLLGRVLPMTIQGDPEQPLTFTIVTGVPRGSDTD